MQKYGKKKVSTPIAGHQHCKTCHCFQKNKKNRARTENKQEVEEQVADIDKRCECLHDDGNYNVGPNGTMVCADCRQII